MTAAMAMVPPSRKKWKKCRARDLWAHKDMVTWNGMHWVEVMSHEVKMLRLWPVFRSLD